MATSSFVTATARTGDANNFPLSLRNSASIPTRRTSVRCASSPAPSRRLVSLSLVFLQFFSISQGARGAGMMDKLDKYMKRKKLDPLEAYIPAVILTELQIKELGQYLDVDRPKFADCRSLLRSGPAASLRINIRAVAEYASDSGNGKAAYGEVDQCLRALEELDSLLLHAARKEDASLETMKRNVDDAVNALNRLLETVPSDVLNKGKAMAEAYLAPEEDSEPGNMVDPELKKLESLL